MYYVSKRVLTVFHIVTHLILTITLQRRYGQPYFTNGETEAQSGSFPSHEARTLKSHNSDSCELDSQAHALTTTRSLTEVLMCLTDKLRLLDFIRIQLKIKISIAHLLIKGTSNITRHCENHDILNR